MSINPELMLIAKIIDTGDMKKALDKGVDAGQFIDETCAEHFAFLVDYYFSPEHPRTVPTRELFKEHYPRDFLPDVDERTTLEELIAAARNKQHLLVCKQISDELLFTAEAGNPMGALERARMEVAAAIGRSRVTLDVILSGYTDTIMQNYRGAKGGQMRGIPWAWDRLNQMTQGMEGGNFILIYGRPKQMKSWVANYMGATFYQNNNRGGRVLLVSMEMSPEIVARRTAGLLTQVDYEKFQQGRLNREEEEAMTEYLEALEKVELADAFEGRKKDFIICYPDDDMNVPSIESKIETHDPDLVIVDGIYRLSDARSKKTGFDWKILANVSRDLKQLAERKRIPIIGVHQANRAKDSDADELEDVAFADNFARDADVLIKCIKIEHPNHGTMVALLFSGAREFKISGFYIHGKPAFNFGHIGDFTSKEELLAFIKKSKESQTKAAGLSSNAPNVGSIMGRFDKNAN